MKIEFIEITDYDHKKFRKMVDKHKIAFLSLEDICDREDVLNEIRKLHVHHSKDKYKAQFSAFEFYRQLMLFMQTQM